MPLVRSSATWVALLMVAAALAGCAGDAPAAKEEPVQKGSTSSPPLSDSGSTQVEPVRPKGTSERWHFHDHWKGNPTITLLETVVTLNATAHPGSAPGLSAIVEFPNGVIVPPETGLLTFNVSWEGQAEGLINLTYRPADSNDFLPFQDLARGVPADLITTESNCDVPHRQQSLWAFNLTAMPGGDPPGLPPREVVLTIQATIGRPLFIDPPHLDWWKDMDTIPVVDNAQGEFAGAATPEGNLSLTGGAAPAVAPANVRVPVDAGRIVPEGTRSVVVVLNWTSQMPDAKLAVHYRESNYPSSGPLQVAQDAKGSRVFVLPVQAPQTDTTYSNRTTWEFHVAPESGAPVSGFQGSFTLTAWASRLLPEAAVAQVANGE